MDQITLANSERPLDVIEDFFVERTPVDVFLLPPLLGNTALVAVTKLVWRKEVKHIVVIHR